MRISTALLFITCTLPAEQSGPSQLPAGKEYQPNTNKQELPPEVEIHTEIAKKRALDQTAHVLNKMHECKCLRFSGATLIACLDYAEKKEVRKTFKKMSYHARIDYLMTMSLLEYKRFLDAFEHEKEWKETLQSLPAHEQKLLPQTILEQLIMIRDTWVSCADRLPGKYTNGSKDPKANDLAAWRNKALEGYETMHKDCPLLWQWLDERFTEKKIDLFRTLKNKAPRKKGGRRG